MPFTIHNCLKDYTIRKLNQNTFEKFSTYFQRCNASHNHVKSLESQIEAVKRDNVEMTKLLKRYDENKKSMFQPLKIRNSDAPRSHIDIEWKQRTCWLESTLKKYDDIQFGHKIVETNGIMFKDGRKKSENMNFAFNFVRTTRRANRNVIHYLTEKFDCTNVYSKNNISKGICFDEVTMREGHKKKILGGKVSACIFDDNVGNLSNLNQVFTFSTILPFIPVNGNLKEISHLTGKNFGGYDRTLKKLENIGIALAEVLKC